MRRLADPLILMIVAWSALALAFFLCPLDFYRPPSATTWGVVIAGVFLYCVGTFIGRLVPFDSPQVGTAIYVQAIVITAIVGLAGIVSLALDKVFLSGLDFSQGLTAMRYDRDQQVVEGIDIHRSPLLYFSYLTFSFSYVSLILFVLKAESIRGSAAWLGQVSIISPVAYALLYGGRAPILLLCALVVGAALTRLRQGLSLFPRAHAVKLKFFVLCACFLIYVNQTWEDRRQLSQTDTYNSFLEVSHASWNMQPSRWLHDKIVHGEIDADSAMNAVSIIYYITHGMISLDRIVQNSHLLSPYFGVYQVGILSPILRIFFPGNTLLDRMWDELKLTELFGWFTTAWGSLYLDFGLWGAIIAIFIWGVAAGSAYRRSANVGCVNSALLSSFWLGITVLTPLSSPIGMANSVLILGSFIATSWWMRGRATRQSGDQPARSYPAAT